MSSHLINLGNFSDVLGRLYLKAFCRNLRKMSAQISVVARDPVLDLESFSSAVEESKLKL